MLTNPSLQPLTRFLGLLILGGLFLVIASCASIRSATYPSDYVYLDNKEVHQIMREMAASVDRLDALLKQTDVEANSKKEQVIGELDKLLEVSLGLGGGGYISNHRVITDNIDTFRRQVRIARKSVDNPQPDYSDTRHLAARCLDCHVKNVSNWGEF